MQLWGYCSGETDRCPRGFNPHSNSYNSSNAVYSTSNLSDTLTYIIIDMRRIRKSFHSHPPCPALSLLQKLIFFSYFSLILFFLLPSYPFPYDNYIPLLLRILLGSLNLHTNSTGTSTVPPRQFRGLCVPTYLGKKNWLIRY